MSIYQDASLGLAARSCRMRATRSSCRLRFRPPPPSSWRMGTWAQEETSRPFTGIAPTLSSKVVRHAARRAGAYEAIARAKTRPGALRTCATSAPSRNGRSSSARTCS